MKHQAYPHRTLDHIAGLAETGTMGTNPSDGVGFSVVLPRGVSGFANWERLFGRQNYSSSKFTIGLRFEF